jgi:Zn-dependent protease with chaperone function
MAESIPVVTSRHHGPGPAASRRGWQPKAPATPPALEDGRLLEYRHPNELPALAACLIVLAVILGVAVWQEKWEILVGIVAVWLSMVATALQAPTFNSLRGAEVTATQFPTVHAIAEELRQRFQMPTTRVFIVRSYITRAFAFGFRAPYVIVLHSSLHDSLDADELRYVLGQQMGHIKFGHTRMDILLGGDDSSLPPILAWASKLRDVIFGWYHRAQVLTADRAGILACRSVEMAFTTQVKFAVGNAQVREVQVADILEQAAAVSQGVNLAQATLINLFSVTPPLIYRLEEMAAWAGRPQWGES